MTKQHKLVALSIVLPVLADFIEDLNDQFVFKQDLKRKANILADEIRKVDNRLLQVQDGNSAEIFKQQIDLQLEFRNWIKETIKFD
tara:strand:+ start:439 stop:696 length:258 start_codon:yes stop_codon:yes gene_type:complete